MEVAATGKAVCRATKMGAVWDRDRDRDRGTSEKLSQQGTKGTSPTRYRSQPRSLSLSCGSENGGTDGDGRKWESDGQIHCWKLSTRQELNTKNLQLSLRFHTWMPGFSYPNSGSHPKAYSHRKSISLAPMNHQILNVTYKPADRPDAIVVNPTP
ncbi:hypothetical protein NC652_030904 [Populus alba x Populus x berolinensis]|nr:hypothetical protein NC652_030904 [Populus alba x Populus x berolinensis]